MNRNKKFSANIGFSSILMVFLTICLVTFASLSVLTANSDYRLSEKLADKTTAYYRGDSSARRCIAAMEQVLSENYQGTSRSEFYDKIEEQLFTGVLPDNVHYFTIQREELFPVISFEIPISTVQTLQVTLEVHYPENEDDRFLTITEWRTKTLNEPTDSMPNLLGS